MYGRPEQRPFRKDRPAGVDARIAQIAERQGGQIHGGQLRSAGLGTGAIKARQRRGQLHRVRWNVYSVGHRREDREALLHAAVLTSGEGAVLSYRAGAAHLGLRPVHGGAIEITAPGQRRARRGIRYVWRTLPDDEMTIHQGLPVTTAPRTLFDLAGVLPERLFRRAVREFEVGPLVGHLSLADLLRRHPRPPGAAMIRAVIAERAPPATSVGSDGEDRFEELVRQGGIRMPSRRYGIAVAGGWMEVDFAWPELRVVVEIDSSLHEVPTAIDEDNDRDQALLAAGWLVFRVTWRQLVREPERVLARLRALLARAEAGRSLRND